MTARGHSAETAAAKRVYSQLQEAVCGRQSTAGGDRAVNMIAAMMQNDGTRPRPDGLAALDELSTNAAHPYKLREQYAMIESSVPGAEKVLPEFAVLLQALRQHKHASAAFSTDAAGQAVGGSRAGSTVGSPVGSRNDSRFGSAAGSPSYRHHPPEQPFSAQRDHSGAAASGFGAHQQQDAETAPAIASAAAGATAHSRYRSTERTQVTNDVAAPAAAAYSVHRAGTAAIGADQSLGPDSRQFDGFSSGVAGIGGGGSSAAQHAVGHARDRLQSEPQLAADAISRIRRGGAGSDPGTPRAALPASTPPSAASADLSGWTPAGQRLRGPVALNGSDGTGPPSKPDSHHGNPLFGQDASTPLPKSWRSVGSGTGDIAAPPASRQSAGQPVLAEIGDLWHQFPSVPAGGSAEPEWHALRPHLTAYDVLQSAEAQRQPSAGPPLHSLPLAVQDASLVEDLLSAFDGVDGVYVRARTTTVEGQPHVAFALDAGRIDATLAEHVRLLLPICESVATLKRFVDTRSAAGWGSVAHAFAAGLRQLLADWSLFTAQLEHRALCGSLPLQALVSECQMPLRTLRLLAGLAAHASATSARGASLLDLLARAAAAAAGDAAARPRLQALLAAAAAPYFRVLHRWLAAGALDDPHAEFLVCEQPDGLRRRFEIRMRPAVAAAQAADGGTESQTQQLVPDVPAMLASSQAAILATGRYLNAVREGGLPAPRTLAADSPVVFDANGGFERAVRTAHTAASAAAVGLLSLAPAGGSAPPLAALKTLQQMMLLQPGAWLGAFLEGPAAAELAAPAGSASTEVLHSLLLQALRETGVPEEAAKAVRVVRDHRSVKSMHSNALDGPQRFVQAAAAAQGQAQAQGRQSVAGDSSTMRSHFMLSYEVTWPLSVLVPPLALAQYQMLFRLQFELATAQRDLAATAQLHKAARRLPGAAVLLAAADAVRCAMAHTLGQLQLYLATGVIAPALEVLQGELRGAKTLEEAAAAHEACIARLLRGCLLAGRSAALRHLTVCRKHASDFAALLLQKLPQVAAGQETGVTPRRGRAGDRARAASASLQGRLGADSFQRAVQQAEADFAAQLQGLICELARAHRAAREEGGVPRPELAALQRLIAGLGADNAMAITVAVEDALADAGLAV